MPAEAAAIAVFRNTHLPPDTPAQPADVVVTLHYPNRQNDVAGQNDVDHAENPGQASGAARCSCLAPRFGGRLVLT
jgi:hypothetical protein